MMSKEQIKQKEMKSVDDVQSALKDLFAETIQEMLEAEMESSLGYAKHDMKRKRTTNSRNGYSKKTIRSEYSEVDIQVPCDREGEFEPAIVKKHQSNVTGIEDQILAMYAKGVSTHPLTNKERLHPRRDFLSLHQRVKGSLRLAPLTLLAP